MGKFLLIIGVIFIFFLVVIVGCEPKAKEKKTEIKTIEKPFDPETGLIVFYDLPLYSQLLCTKYEIMDSLLFLLNKKSTIGIDSLSLLTKIERRIIGNILFDERLLGLFPEGDMFNLPKLKIIGQCIVFQKDQKKQIIASKYGINDSICKKIILGCKMTINTANKQKGSDIQSQIACFLDSISVSQNITKATLASILLDYFMLNNIKDLEDNQQTE
ncbi:MAG: hypothetical protein NT040_18110 [Bacteroidetes bacterium]|nr:hypothetical protein [Bacteroidota bacterium]